MSDVVRVGAGAGYAGDRVEPAVTLAKQGDLDYLCFEGLGERTLALAQQRRRQGKKGYNLYLEERMRRVLPACDNHGTTVITNMGSAAPQSAAEAVAEIARKAGLSLTVASVVGSDVSDKLDQANEDTFEGECITDFTPIVAADAYVGVDGLVSALEAGADVIITDRVADTSLFLAPLVYEFGWSVNPLDSEVAQGIVAAHLIECAGQVTGGYFADPDHKEVEGLSNLGFPLAEVTADGEVSITKPSETGGKVTVDTCTEQLLYEIHDPSRYITPDAVADFSNVQLEAIGETRVQVRGALAQPRTDTLKVNICYEDSVVGEGQISYGGPGALDRARLASEIVRERLTNRSAAYDELRIDHVGIDSLHGKASPKQAEAPYEVRLRVTARCDSRQEATKITNEIETLYTNGPAGGGGVTTDVREIIGLVSTLIDREAVHPQILLHTEMDEIKEVSV